MYSEKQAYKIITLVFELKLKGYKCLVHKIGKNFNVTVEGKIEKSITGSTSVPEVEKLIKDLENLNK